MKRSERAGPLDRWWRVVRFHWNPLVLVVCLVGAAFLGCSRGPRPDPLAKESACLPSEASPFASTAVTGADIYLDDSETMRGFLSDPEHPMPVTLLQRLLQSLLVERLGDVGLPPPSLYTFGLNVDPGPLPLGRLRDFVAVRDSYQKGENDIAAAFERAAEKPESLSIVITDNTQDVLTSKGGRAPGFDRSGIVRAVSENLAGKGFGVWLLGFQSDFDGVYYSVLPTLEATGVRTNRSFDLKGRRPVYCWVFSRDWEKGRKLALDLIAELRRLVPAEEAESSVNGLELYPGIVPSLTLEEPDPRELAPPVEEPRKARAGLPRLIDTFQVRSWTSFPGNPRSSAAELTFQQPRTTEIHFLVKARLLREEGEALRPLGLPVEAWKVTPGQTGNLGATLTQEIRHFNLSEAPPPAAGQSHTYWELAVPYNRLVATDRSRWNLKTDFSIDAGLKLARADAWLKAWSAEDDTSPEKIEGKTIYLNDIASRIVERTVGRARLHGCLVLRFSRN